MMYVLTFFAGCFCGFMALALVQINKDDDLS